MWKKKLVWKNTSLQFEVITPEDIVEEVNAQRDTFSFKASFKDPDSAHVVNEIELTIKRSFVNLPPKLLQPEDIKPDPEPAWAVADFDPGSMMPEPREYHENEANMSKASGLTKLEKSWSSDDTVSGQKKRNDEANGDVVSADRSAPPQGQGSPKKISLKVIDESSREMVFSVSPSTKLRKLMMNYSKRLELDVSCFKFIFDGRRILEDETVKQLEMEDGDTINVVSNVSPMVTLARDHDTEIQLDKSTLIRDRPSLPDSNDNIETKSSSQTKKEGMEHAHKFRIGDLVWVFSTIKENPPLPGKICMPPQDVKRPPIKHQMHCVQFFGGNVICWIEEFRIKDYYEQLKDTLFVKNKPTKQMSQALQSLKSRDTKGRSTESEEKEKSDARVRGALPAANKKLEKSEAKKREANDSDSSASGPSSTKMARVTQTKAIGF